MTWLLLAYRIINPCECVCVFVLSFGIIRMRRAHVSLKRSRNFICRPKHTRIERKKKTKSSKPNRQTSNWNWMSVWVHYTCGCWCGSDCAKHQLSRRNNIHTREWELKKRKNASNFPQFHSFSSTSSFFDAFFSSFISRSPAHWTSKHFFHHLLRLCSHRRRNVFLCENYEIWIGWRWLYTGATCNKINTTARRALLALLLLCWRLAGERESEKEKELRRRQHRLRCTSFETFVRIRLCQIVTVSIQ